MNITFAETELANFITKVEKWHRERFQYVLLNVAQNYDPYYSTHAVPIPVAQLKDLITKFDTLFEKDHPYPHWKELL